MKEKEEPFGIDVVFHPDITPEQGAVVFGVLRDLFHEAGGVGDLMIERAEMYEADGFQMIKDDL